MSTTLKKIEAGCPTCHGRGFDDGAFCDTCKGKGKVSLLETQTRKCPDCNGRGHVEHVPCPPCAHTGKVMIDAAAAKIAADKAEDEANAAAAALETKLEAAFEDGKKAGYDEYLAAADKNPGRPGDLKRIAELEAIETEFAKENKALEKELKKLRKQAAEPPAAASETTALEPDASTSQAAPEQG